ncbi:MAG: thaumatin family protein [Rhodospirillales bacterium]
MRSITLRNACPFPVYPGATVGAVGLAGAPVMCNAGACATGQFCNSADNMCYWAPLQTKAGKPLDAYSVQLATSGNASNVVVNIPVNTTGATDTVWSGGIWAGTDVSGAPTPRTVATAATGYCAQSKSAVWQLVPCTNQTVAPQNAPVTVAEFTLVNSLDTYDITAINGVNVPITMAPSNGQTLPPPPASNDPNSKYYWCATPGAKAAGQAPTPGQACKWSFAAANNKISMALVQHQANAQLCGPSQACPSGQTCGISYDSSQGVAGVSQQCGTPLSGTWTAVQICAAVGYQNSNLVNVSPQLKQSLDCQGTGGANSKLFQCSGNGTCYNSAAGPTCCGCPNWPAQYNPAGGNSAAANRCYSTNPNWTSVAYPWLSYVKSACPTMYSFQYDDVTSTFNCSTVPDGQTGTNATNYTITFCPGGATATVGAISITKH